MTNSVRKETSPLAPVSMGACRLPLGTTEPPRATKPQRQSLRPHLKGPSRLQSKTACGSLVAMRAVAPATATTSFPHDSIVSFYCSPQLPSKKVLRRPIESTQYTSDQFQRLLAEHGVACSMSRAGNCWDNAATESFFSSLKTERIARKTYRTRDQAKADVFDYVERWYNPQRRHSTLGYLSPIAFEQQEALA
jgi:putative transposase